MAVSEDMGMVAEAETAAVPATPEMVATEVLVRAASRTRLRAAAETAETAALGVSQAVAVKAD
ncbi:hypothetical protein [Mycolicibacter senuensis]|uniref:hypothetical protein n=1 Tax=Mycolicibacter senuensis TaxID=386913 RepID=UPI0010577C80|nr:hypothetical protein [Mycolicibacter senuensis]